MFRMLVLIRWRSILYAAFIMYAMRYMVVRPILEINDLTLQMTEWAFFLLVLAIGCLVAAGNVINDYFDTKADRITGIKKIVVGKHISRRAAIFLHTVLNLLSIGIAFYLSFAVGIWKIGILFLLASGLIWFYSSTYKRYFLIGNLLVGGLAALIPLSVVFFELPLLNMAYADFLIDTQTNFLYLFRWVGFFSFFVFMNTWMYEINKDIFTARGDKEDWNRTVPVEYGKKAATWLICVLAFICVVTSGILGYRIFSDYPCGMFYIGVGVVLPYIFYMGCVVSGKGSRRLQLGLIRAIMVLCIAFSFLLPHFFHLLFSE